MPKEHHNHKIEDHVLYTLFEYNKNGRIKGMNWYPSIGELYTYENILRNEFKNDRNNKVMEYNLNVLKRVLHLLIWNTSMHPEQDHRVRNVIEKCKDKRYREKYGGKILRNFDKGE